MPISKVGGASSSISNTSPPAGGSVAPQPSQGGTAPQKPSQGGKTDNEGFYYRNNINLVTEAGAFISTEDGKFLISFLDPGELQKGSAAITPED